MKNENQIKIDLMQLGFYFENPTLFNDGIQNNLYQVQSSSGLSQTTISRLGKKGVKFFSLTLNNPIDGLSTSTILFVRNIRN